MNRPTDKQIELARKIADMLEIELPKELINSAYCKFIKDNMQTVMTKWLKYLKLQV